jgi:hypothetical protein
MKPERNNLMRAVSNFLMVCSLSLPMAVYADVLPRQQSPDLLIDSTSGSVNALSGTVESIADGANGCSSLCYFADLSFSSTSTGFEVTDGATVLLAGDLVQKQTGTGNQTGEYGFLYHITTDDTAGWSALETALLKANVTASSFGSDVVFDYDAVDGVVEGFGDLSPAAVTPEPATLTLLITGMGVGLYRRRRLAGRS